MNEFRAALDKASAYLAQISELQARYRAGDVHVRVPERFLELDRPIEDLVTTCLPASHAALEAASKSLFFSLPVAFDPARSIGPYLATVDVGPDGESYRFLDMGAQIATHGFGENDPDVVAAVLENLPYAVARYAHSEYQTALSLRLKAALSRIAPAGTPRHFVVNTGAEAVENAIKSVLLNRVMAGAKDGGFIISFDGAFHGRTLGSLAVTHRKKARLGFPTFDWPHASFPANEPRAPKETARREERSLRQIWELLVSGRQPGADKSKDLFQRELEAIDAFLERPGADVKEFVAAARSQLSADVRRRAHRVAAVLVEPIQGEGGVRMTTARFMRRLRILTRIYDVPLVFDEVQSGWGTCGTLWAHELFELPLPPDVVIWAKKAQNGVLFVSHELATFFQEEKKFNTTWEGDSVGMVRLLAQIGKLDLEQVRRTSALSRTGLEALCKDYPDLLKNVRGAGVMLGFEVVRSDLRDMIRDMAFRRGLLLLPAGERVLRFYPRYDTEPYAIEEALSLLRLSVEDVVSGRIESEIAHGPEVRVGEFECPLDAIEVIEVTPESFPSLRVAIQNVETARYGDVSQYPGGIHRKGQRPLLQVPVERLGDTLAAPQSIGIALRDRVSDRIVAYALGTPVENIDEEGVASDPHFGESNTFYLHAMATLPSVQNQTAIENHVLDLVRERARAMGYRYFSTLIEERVHAAGPPWFRQGSVFMSIDSYLRSGIRFVYVQAPLDDDTVTASEASFVY